MEIYWLEIINESVNGFYIGWSGRSTNEKNFITKMRKVPKGGAPNPVFSIIRLMEYKSL